MDAYDDYGFEGNRKQSTATAGDMGSNASHDQLVLHQIQLIVPMVIGILLIIVLTTGVTVCVKRSKYLFYITHLLHCVRLAPHTSYLRILPLIRITF